MTPDGPSFEDILAAIRRLRELFYRNGYLREPNEHQKFVGREHGTYHKGYELRLVVSSEQELEEVRRLLDRLAFKLAAPHRKGKLFRQPVYGKEPVERFLALVGGPPGS